VAGIDITMEVGQLTDSITVEAERGCARNADRFALGCHRH
jgi:hypothetical protein